jgi:hypothetical protein
LTVETSGGGGTSALPFCRPDDGFWPPPQATAARRSVVPRTWVRRMVRAFSKSKVGRRWIARGSWAGARLLQLRHRRLDVGDGRLGVRLGAQLGGGRELFRLDLAELALAQLRPAREPAEVGRRLEAGAEALQRRGLERLGLLGQRVAVDVDRLLVGPDVRRDLGGEQRVREVLRDLAEARGAGDGVGGLLDLEDQVLVLARRLGGELLLLGEPRPRSA